MFLMCSMSVIYSLSFSISLRRRRFSRSLEVDRLMETVSCLLFHISTSDFFWLMSLANFSFSESS